MAHNIEVYTNALGEKKESFVGNGPAWHNLGTVYDRPLTVVEALEGCNANFEVTKQPILTVTDDLRQMIENGQFINASMLKDLIIPQKVATFRDDRKLSLGVVSDSYGVIQNAEAFKFVDALCTGGMDTPVIDAAGVLGNGERIFVTAKFPEPIILNNKTDDIVNMYIVFTTSHDGTGACCAMVTPTRVVCQNTLNAAFGNCTGRWNLRHTRFVSDKLQDVEDAAKTLKLYNLYKDEFENKMKKLAGINVTDKQVEMIAAHTIMSPASFETYKNSQFNLNCDDLGTRAKNQVNALIETIHSGVGQDSRYGVGNGLWLYNGITTHFSNEVDYNNPNKRFHSLMDDNGNSYQKSNKAMQTILGLAA